MASNENLMKADLAVSDLESNGGKLTAEQANRFNRKLRIQPSLLNSARVVEMTAPERNINKIGFGSRIMFAAPSANTSPADSKRSKPSTEQVKLKTEETMAWVRLPYDVLEDNIERAQAAQNEDPNARDPEGLKGTLIDLIAERASIDLEELAVYGDTSSTDSYLALQDGWLKTVENNGNVVDRASTAIDKTLFRDGMLALDNQYKQQLQSMRHYVSHDQEIAYKDTLADRGTALGDQAVDGNRQVSPYGIPLESVGQLANADALTTNPSNLIFGTQRDISMEFDKDITARAYDIVVTARVAVSVEESEAAVRYKNIGAPA